MESKPAYLILIAFTASAPLGCASVKSIFVPSADKGASQAPIRNPFGAYYGGSNSGNVVVRNKQGDHEVDVELPENGDSSDLVVPLGAFGKSSGRGPASTGPDSGDAGATTSGIDESYRNRKPTASDREILSTFPQTTFDDRGRRTEIEEGLGLVPADDPVPQGDSSYLAGVDRVKQLYRNGRFEAALLETDDLIKSYQTDGHLYEMRGTLLDRLGKRELAIKSWSQSLRFNPGNQALRRFLDRKRRVASQAAGAEGASGATPDAPASVRNEESVTKTIGDPARKPADDQSNERNAEGVTQ